MSTMRYPKNYNRVMAVRPADKENAPYMVIAEGIMSRANNISETTESYQYLSGRGTAEKAVTGQEVGVSFSGHRKAGDPAQDYILDEVLYDIDSRDVEFLDYDDGIESGPNGYKGRANIQITDFGSGDAGSRQNIGFTLNFQGKPEKGTVAKSADNKLTFTSVSPTPEPTPDPAPTE